MARTSNIRRTSARSAAGEPKAKTALTPEQALAAPDLTMRQTNAALKRHSSNIMASWPIERVAEFWCRCRSAQQAAESILIGEARTNGGYYLFERTVDGKGVSGLYVDERATETLTFNPERMAQAFMLYHNLHNDSARDRLARVFEMLTPAQRNRIMLANKGSKGAPEPLLAPVREYAEKHLNEDGLLLMEHVGTPEIRIRQTPPGMGQGDEDE